MNPEPLQQKARDITVKTKPNTVPKIEAPRDAEGNWFTKEDVASAVEYLNDEINRLGSFDKHDKQIIIDLIYCAFADVAK